MLDIEGDGRNLHAYTHQKIYFFARVSNHQGRHFTAVLLVVAKQRSRLKQDQRVFLSGYNPGLALKQIKLEESTGADLVDMIHEKDDLCG